MIKYYTYCCPICLYQGNSITYFNNRVNSDKHICLAVKRTDDLEKYKLTMKDFETKEK